MTSTTCPSILIEAEKDNELYEGACPSTGILIETEKDNEEYEGDHYFLE